MFQGSWPPPPPGLGCPPLWVVGVGYAFHAYPNIFHTYCRHTPYIFNAYSMHIPCIFHTYSIHTPYTYQQYFIRIPCIFHAYTIHIPCICHTYSMHVPFIFHTHSLRISYIYQQYFIRIPYISYAYSQASIPGSQPTSQAQLASQQEATLGGVPGILAPRTCMYVSVCVCVCLVGR